MLKRLLLLILILLPGSASAHPAPFTYLDVRLQPDGVDVTLIAHVFDVAHDLQVQDPSQLLESAFLNSRRAEIMSLFASRLSIGSAPDSAVHWNELGLLSERQSIVLRGRVSAGQGALPIHAQLFPYDPAHQTFVNVYENGALTLQAILDSSKTDLTYFSGSTEGIAAVLSRFVGEGVRHVATGAEHWLFLIGLMLLGGSTTYVVRVVLAFITADVVTTLLIALNVAHPAARLTDPALALSIVYIGADNLMVRGGRDVRPWIALAFGVLHGFWFGGAVALMDLPKRALVWSLISFDLGAVIAQVAVVLLVLGALALLRRSGAASRQIVIAGSVAVLVGGVYLFAQRVFFPGGWL